MARQPIRRYFSMALLNRLTFTEKDALSGMVPEIINALPHDADYEPEPDRTGESLQSWEALRSLNARLIEDEMESNFSIQLYEFMAENPVLNINYSASQVN